MSGNQPAAPSQRALRRLVATLLAGAGLVGVTLAAAGCAPDLGPKPQLNAAASLATTQSFAAVATAWPQDDWWRAYGDPQLDALETEALAGSPDLAQAAARLRQAQAQVEVAGAANKPQLSANASSQTTQQSLNEGFPAQFKPFLPAGWHTQSRAEFALSWDLDFFGANRARLRAALGEAEATRAEGAAARLQLTAAVAAAYAELARLYDDRDAADEALKVRSATFDLVNKRLINGLETRGELAQAQSGIPTARGDLEALDRSILMQRHAIAALLGEGPDRGLAIARPVASHLNPPGLPADAGIDLVGRRPDLLAARLRAQAAADRIKAAHADFYPNVTLTGNYGTTSLGIDKLFQRDSHVGALGPALTLPIFSQGRIEGAYRGARGEYDQAVASYNGALANALRDVADAASGMDSIARQIAQARAAQAAAEESYKVAQLRYGGGLSPFLNVLTAETTLIQSRRTVADLQGQALAQDVALVRALGGGYTAPAARIAALPSSVSDANRPPVAR